MAFQFCKVVVLKTVTNCTITMYSFVSDANVGLPGNVKYIDKA